MHIVEITGPIGEVDTIQYTDARLAQLEADWWNTNGAEGVSAVVKEA